jgi:hypothetical protein
MYEQYTTACAGPGVSTAIPPTTLIKAADSVRAYFIADAPARPIEKVLNSDDWLRKIANARALRLIQIKSLA